MINCNCCLALNRLPCVQFLRSLGEVFETNHNGRTVSAGLTIDMFRSVGYWTDFWSEVSLIFVPWIQFWLEEDNFIHLTWISKPILWTAKTDPSYKHLYKGSDIITTQWQRLRFQKPVANMRYLERAVWGSHCICVFFRFENEPVYWLCDI
jgi:hypothetical protein